jgi:hypothetical protein
MNAENASDPCGCIFKRYGIGLAGAIVGAIVGHLLFWWIAGQGFYALPLPGALAGIGCALAARRRSICLGISAGLIALIAGILSEWRLAPFIADKSLAYFLTHLHDLQILTIILILVGMIFAVWFVLRPSVRGVVLRPDDSATEIEYALFKGQPVGFAVVGFDTAEKRVWLEIARTTAAGPPTDTARIIAEFDKAMVLAAESADPEDDKPPYPWPIKSFASTQGTETRWRFTLTTSKIECRFEAEWPAVQFRS